MTDPITPGSSQDDNPFRNMIALMGLKKPEPKGAAYAAGPKMYGLGSYSATAGPVDKAGYRQRDMNTQARKNAVLRRLKAEQAGNLLQPDVLRAQKGM